MKTGLNKQGALDEISTIEQRLRVVASQGGKTKSLSNKLIKARQLLMYIETGVSKDQVEKQIEELKRKIGLIDNGFETWLKFNTTPHQNPLQVYRKEMERSKYVNQLSTLKKIIP